MTSPRSGDGDRPKVSVLLPVYNARDHLREAVDSILAQTFTDFELLAHDDGSTDGSLAILEAYARRDPRVRVGSAPNAGITATLNRLIAAARGPYLARMDADDICLPDRFAAQVAYLDAHPDIAVLGTDWLTIDDAGRPFRYFHIPRTHEELDARHLRGHCTIMHPTVMMRRDVVARAGGYDERFRSAQDLDLWLRLGERGKIANLPRVLLEYRVHANSISATRQQEQLHNIRQSCAAACTRRGVEVACDVGGWRMDDTPASKRKFYLRYAWQAWNAGFRDTWRHYALKSLRLAPFSPEAWKVLILGALRRPKRQGRHD